MGSPYIIFFIIVGVARDLWTFVFCLLGVSWVMQKSLFELLISWKGTFGKKRSLYIYIYIFFFWGAGGGGGGGAFCYV
jgi:hypothetical protein